MGAWDNQTGRGKCWTMENESVGSPLARVSPKLYIRYKSWNERNQARGVSSLKLGFTHYVLKTRTNKCVVYPCSRFPQYLYDNKKMSNESLSS
jgi:hypothetical protein